MMNKSLLGLALPVCILSGCTSVEGTGRKQLMLISASDEMKLGAQAYQEILTQEAISDDPQMNEVLQRVGTRIAEVANRPDYAWEFKLIESNQVNAFCLPGGKIAVYTGILPIMQNEAGMAAVIGHEVAHAIARHAGERMSQQMSVEVINMALSEGLKNAEPETRDMTMAAFGATTKVGVLLPYSRTHELEADQLGLIYAAKAGYDPREAVRLWERMKESGGKKPPEFLSTHPSEERRINRMQDLMPRAIAAYDKAPEQYGLGVKW